MCAARRDGEEGETYKTIHVQFEGDEMIEGVEIVPAWILQLLLVNHLGELNSFIAFWGRIIVNVMHRAG